MHPWMGGCRCNINSTSSSPASAVAFIVLLARYNLYRAWSLTKAGTVLFGVTEKDISLEMECVSHMQELLQLSGHDIREEG